MTENDMQEFLEANKAEIQAEVKRRMIEGLVQTHRWSISEEITATVNAFVQAEIVPVVKAHLEGEKGAIIEAAKVACVEISNSLAKVMVEKAAKNMEGYRYSELIKGLFS